ncbi:hypothetical protein [Flavobacterium columnare]|uniref:hypothetical protein n=1 Tax=Flavobacterium columnare TaxID=996 RepID=UPI0040348B6A
MSKILSPIKQRILYYIEKQGFEKIKFLEKLELSPSNFRGQSLFSEVGGDVIVKILSQDTTINADWLILGIGEMLKTNNTMEAVQEKSGVDYKELAESRKETIESQKETIATLKDKNIYLESEVARLKQELANATGNQSRVAG